MKYLEDEDIQYEVRIEGAGDVIVFNYELEALQRANEINRQYLDGLMRYPDRKNIYISTVATVHEIKESGINPGVSKPFICHKHG